MNIIPMIIDRSSVTMSHELMLAIEHGQLRKIKLLHQKDETLMSSKHELAHDQGKPVFDTVLNYAIGIGSKKTVIFLIEEFKLDIREIGAFGRNCIFSAFVGRKFEIAKYLHSLDKTLIRAKDVDGNPGLCFASGSSSKEIVQWLIEEVKCDILETGFKGGNCILAAIAYDEIETVNYLHSVDGNLIKAKDENGIDALMLAIVNASVEMIQLLIEKCDLDVHKADTRGWNCFHVAAHADKMKILAYLDSIEPVSGIRQVRIDLNLTRVSTSNFTRNR